MCFYWGKIRKCFFLWHGQILHRIVKINFIALMYLFDVDTHQNNVKKEKKFEVNDLMNEVCGMRRRPNRFRKAVRSS